jgi:hypothetical protein
MKQVCTWYWKVDIKLTQGWYSLRSPPSWYWYKARVTSGPNQAGIGTRLVLSKVRWAYRGPLILMHKTSLYTKHMPIYHTSTGCNRARNKLQGTRQLSINTGQNWFEPRTSTNSPPELPSCKHLQHQIHYRTFKISSRRLGTPSCQCHES